jgi:hypothetical protein
VIKFDVGLLLAEFLARIKFNDLAAGFGGFIDRLKHREAIEGPGLATDRETAGLAGFGNGCGKGGRRTEDAQANQEGFGEHTGMTQFITRAVKPKSFFVSIELKQIALL